VYLNKLLILFLLLGVKAKANVVTPQFSSGTLNSRQEVKTVVVENIVSVDYTSGYQYTVSGTGIEPVDGDMISPKATLLDAQTVDGVTFQWTGIDASTKPDWKLTTPGGSFNFSESLLTPSLSNVTNINRTTTTESIVESVSVFLQ
tara:strand:- start:283 stop:720 length:438 start_codon:yes stop_codon:yes gene_type:complete